MIKTKTSSTLFAALIMILIFSIATMAVERTNDYERIKVDYKEQTTKAVTEGFEYCPDGTMVEDLEDCPDFVDDELIDASTRIGRNPQTGKEIQIAARTANKATITTDAGKVYYADVELSHKSLDKASPALANTVCGISQDNELVCEVTPFNREDDGKLYCWGKNELRECPDKELMLETGRGGGSGKVSVSNFKIESKAQAHEDEIEVFSWSWGSSRDSGYSDVDGDGFGDELELSYVWSVNKKSDNSSNKPAETLSLSFTKIEFSSGNGGSGGYIQVDLPELEVQKDSLIFTTINFEEFAVSNNNERCELSRILVGDDCDDYDSDIRPDRVVDVTGGIVLEDGREMRKDSNNVSPDFLDLDDDGDGILTRTGNNTRIIKHLDKATPLIFSSNNNEEFDEEDKENIREYLSNLDEIKGRDFGLSVALAASENPRVREVRYREDTNTVEIEHNEEVRFLGFVKLNARALTTIDEQGNEETKYPWWSALATKSEKSRFKAGAELSKKVN